MARKNAETFFAPSPDSRSLRFARGPHPTIHDRSWLRREPLSDRTTAAAIAAADPDPAGTVEIDRSRPTTQKPTLQDRAQGAISMRRISRDLGNRRLKAKGIPSPGTPSLPEKRTLVLYFPEEPFTLRVSIDPHGRSIFDGGEGRNQDDFFVRMFSSNLLTNCCSLLGSCFTASS